MKLITLFILTLSLDLFSFENGLYKNSNSCEMLISCFQASSEKLCSGYLKKGSALQRQYFDINEVPVVNYNSKVSMLFKTRVIPDSVGQPVYYQVNGSLRTITYKGFLF